RDGDGVVDETDNCPVVPNPGQQDLDQDGIGDDCDPDRDGDGVVDETDNCPVVPNPGQQDLDQDGIGDDCDPDRDGDGDPDVTDCEPSNPYISTNAKESCNGYDDDCDGLVDEEGSIDCLLYFSDQDADGYGSNVDFLCLCGPYGVYSTRFSGDCADQDSTRHPGLPEICDGRDNNCDDVADESPCPQPMIVIPGSASSGPPIQNPIGTGICAVFGTFPGGPNTNDERNLPAFMALLDGMNGASSSAISSVPQLNFGHFPNTGAYYTGDYPGADTVPVAGSGALAARFRGFLVISEPVVWTMELMGSDAVKLIIAGNVAALLSWANRGWKYSVGVRFESAGIYPIEIQWSTNQLSANAYDVLELGYAWGVQSGDNGVMHCAPQVLQCSWKPSAAYQLVPSSLLIASSDGQPVDCQPCDSDEQCAPGHVCNAAGICQAVL
ncbi:thrombospondin type 3 repeat-containing protein, partial [Myxococcota bacterium]|nr:thrombospondin type 3 repeat-containing protein [Myxococcota bacterium]